MSKEMKVGPTSKRLGEYLDCEAVAVEAALAIQARAEAGEPHKRLGEILLEIRAVGLDTLLQGVQAQRADRLAACPLFGALSRPELEDLTAVFQEVSVPAGVQFINQDENDPYLFVLASGTLKVYRLDDADGEIPLARVFPGEPVGEMGYFADGVRSACVRSLEHCQLLRAGYDDLTDCFETVPAVASAFMDVVTHRLRKTNVLFQQNKFQGDRESGSLEHLGAYLEPAELEELEGHVDDLFARLVHTASWLTDADRASLFLIDEEDGELWSKVAQGAEVKEIRIRAGTGVVGWTIAHNELVNVEDAYADERFNPEVDKKTGYRTNTILCTPVRDQDRHVIGALQVINKGIGVFTEDDESLARAVASQAALGIENINLFREVLDSHRRATDLLSVATICSEAPDQMTLGTRVGEAVATLARCDQARMYFVDAEAGSLWCAVPGVEGEERLSLLIDDSLAGHAVTTGESINIRDAYEDDRFESAWERDRGVRIRNALCIPIHDRDGRTVGALEMVNRLDGVFDEEDEQTARALAAQLGVARLVANG